MYVVKRFSKPTYARACDGKVYEFLTKNRGQNKWSVNSEEARVFTNPGHAKTALRRLAAYALNARDATAGDTVFICRATITTHSPQQWIVA